MRILARCYSRTSPTGVDPAARRCTHGSAGLGWSNPQLLSIHVSWPSATDPWNLADAANSAARVTYYGVTGAPSLFLDGVFVGTPGYIPTQTQVTTAINNRRNVDSPVWIKVRPSVNATGDSIIADIRYVSSTPLTGTTYKLRVFINEVRRVLAAPSPNGQTVFDFSICNSFPNAAGTTALHSGSTSDTVNVRAAFLIRRTGGAPFTVDNSCLVTFIQNETTHEVLQTNYTNVSAIRYPVGGETVYVGDTLRVRWDATAFSGNVNIALNRDYPAGTWTDILTNVANTGTADWLITGPATTTARVSITTVGVPSETDMSKSNFNILSPTNVTCTPNPISATVNALSTGSTLVTVSNSGSTPYVGTMTANLGTSGFVYAPATQNWVDATAGVSGPTGDDVMGGPFALPFAFPFYGSTYNSVYMCTNGFLSFTPGATSAYSNTTFPESAAATMVAPFWDDLNVTGSGTTRVWMDAANNRAVFAWNSVPLYSPSSSNATFEVILYSDGRIEFEYGAFVGTMSSATVGVQGSPANFIQVIYNTPVAPATAYAFSPRYAWGVPTLSTFSVAAGGSQEFTINWNSASYPNDTTLTGSLAFAGNIVGFTVPVTLTVTAVSANEPVAVPNEFTMSEAYPNPFNPTTTVKFSLAATSPVSLKLYDINGRLVSEIFSGNLPAGDHVQMIRGDHLATGTYFVKLEAGNKFSAVRKLALIK